MKNNRIPDDENLSAQEMAALMRGLGPKFKIGQKVWIRCGGDGAGMVTAIVSYANRYGYRVRFADATLDDFDDYELTDCKTWE